MGLIPGSERSPGEGHGNPVQYSCLENPHRQRSLASSSPWGCKESDISERLNTHTSVGKTAGPGTKSNQCHRIINHPGLSNLAVPRGFPPKKGDFRC